MLKTHYQLGLNQNFDLSNAERVSLKYTPNDMVTAETARRHLFPLEDADNNRKNIDRQTSFLGSKGFS